MYNMYPYMPQQTPAADIGQVQNEQEAVNAYVAAGRSKIMFTPDDQTIFVKVVSMNGQTTMDIFDRRAGRQVPAASDFITRKEFTEAMEALKGAKKTIKEGSAE